MKGKRYRWKIILGSIFLGIIFLFSLDSDISYRDDYYDVVNEEVLAVDHLKEEDYHWSTFTEAIDVADEKMHQVFLDCLEKNTYRGLNVVYENAVDMEKRNLDGISDLDSYLVRIQDISDVMELVDVISLIERELGIPILTNIVVDRDYLDNQYNMVYLYPISFVFGVSSDYFVLEDYMVYKAYLKRAMIQLLEVYGYSRNEAREVVSNLILFYEDVGSNSKSLKELSDVESYYHKVSFEEMKAVYSNVSIERYWKDLGIASLKEYSLVDEEQYKKWNQYLKVEYLDTWKDHLLIMVLSTYASYLTEDYEKVVMDFNQGITATVSENKTREEISEDMVQSLFSLELDKVYEGVVLGDNDKKYLYGMFDDMKDSYRKMLKGNDWLSEETIAKAIDKLDHMKIYVGLDGLEGDNSSLDKLDLVSWNEGGSLIQNVLEMVRFRRKEDLERLENGNGDRAIGESVVNAYYSPMNNAIYIPAAVSFLVDLEDTYYDNLGKIGMILAHEMTHGFDWNGSKFDSLGNFRNWWKDKDREAFLELRNQVQEYYSRYEVIDGRFIDGELTVNENIADLGALRCISLVAEHKGATKKEFQNMYSSFASLWASQSNDQYMRLLLLQDTHAPNKYRVNAVLSSLDEFYSVYDVYFWNDMYIQKEDRVQVW